MERLADRNTPIVIIESPFSGLGEKGLIYARAALLDSINRGEGEINDFGIVIRYEVTEICIIPRFFCSLSTLLPQSCQQGRYPYRLSLAT